jgi:uncharacterized phiE125 gp8 family phage protein
MNYKYYNIPNIKQVTAPAAEPVSVDELKSFLRIDSNFEDELLQKIISSARVLVEEYTKRSLVNQAWKISFDDFAPRNVRLIRGPVASITSVNVIAENNSVSLVDESNYQLSVSKEYLIFEKFIAGKQIEINYATGYGADGANVPEPLKLAILTLCSKIYERKPEAFQIDETLKNLINPYRTYEL